jgi:hypothetical protein
MLLYWSFYISLHYLNTYSYGNNIIYNILETNNQIGKISVCDFVTHMKEIKKVKINEQWPSSTYYKNISKNV